MDVRFPIGVYEVTPSSGALTNVAARTLTTGIGVAGLCMYRSPASRKYYVFVGDSSGTLQQWELFDDGTGRVDARKVRTLTFGSTTEGCVADDLLGNLYVSEEDVAIWKYRAEPTAGANRVAVDRVGRFLRPDIEGPAIYSSGRRGGYLVASSQGSDSFAVYRRAGSNRHVANFVVGRGAIDGVTHTDGIDVTSRPLGGALAKGLFVAQDDHNDGGNQNFKLVPWGRISRAMGLQSAARHAAVGRSSRGTGGTGVTYYVDGTTGDASNRGTSRREPWKTVARADSARLNPGDRLLLRRGRVWVGALTLAAKERRRDRSSSARTEGV